MYDCEFVSHLITGHKKKASIKKLHSFIAKMNLIIIQFQLVGPCSIACEKLAADYSRGPEDVKNFMT